MSFSQPVVKACDLAEDVREKVLQLSAEAVGTYTVEREIAAYLKKELDLLYGALWHVVVGRSFGSYVTHELGFFAYYFIGELAFIVFKS